MKRQSILGRFAVFVFVLCNVLVGSSCNRSPGRPGPHSEVIRPSDVTDFKVLYKANCAGCHGHDGKGGAATPLGDQVFLAIADDDVIRRTASRGVEGTPMPAFAKSDGGMLTDKQIDVIVNGIRSWARPEAVGGARIPPYAVANPGDAGHGAEVFAVYCSACHGADGRGGKQASSIVNGSYLALVSDQNLRTMVIVGRPDLGAPDWRNDVSGKPMSEQDISDVVAWLAAQRPQFPGQPYPSASLYTGMGVAP